MVTVRTGSSRRDKGMITRRKFNTLIAAGSALPFMGAAGAQEAGALTSAVEELDQLHSLQVQRGGEVVFATAPRGNGLDAIANIKSCSKSLVALLLGTCLERGEIASLDTPLVEAAPDLVPNDATEGASGITIGNLVTLQAGLERTSGGNYGAWIASANWVANALRRPMVGKPGGRMIYSTGTTHVLGAVLARATGLSLLELARQRLGGPMDFEVPPWTRDPQGFYLGGNEMALTPRAMLKIATLVRDGGRFEAEQVIPADWIRESLIPRGRSHFSGMEYGYGWFLTQSGYALARGYGGQVIAAHREAGLAVAITSDPTQPARSEGYFGDLANLLDGPILALA